MTWGDGAIVGVLVGALLLLWGRVGVTVQAPAPVVVPAPVVQVVASHRQRTGPAMDIRLMDGDERTEIGTFRGWQDWQRQATLQTRTADGRVKTFVAARVGADGVWIYRQVGEEREA